MIGDVNAKYSLYGYAAPWKNADCVILLNSEAEQIVTPLEGNVLKGLGLLNTN